MLLVCSPGSNDERGRAASRLPTRSPSQRLTSASWYEPDVGDAEGHRSLQILGRERRGRAQGGLRALYWDQPGLPDARYEQPQPLALAIAQPFERAALSGRDARQKIVRILRLRIA